MKRGGKLSGLTDFTKPKSIAVVGASRSPGKVGNSVIKNLINSGYSGQVYPVNPREEEIEGLPCFPSLLSTPGPVDMAIFAVPANLVLKAAEECGQKGVKNLVVLTAGFKELGIEGMEIEKQLVKTCRKFNMRLMGPNCIGFIDTHTPVNATFMSSYPAKGGIAFISQSGAILAAILDWSRLSGIGFSKVVSLGNKADLSESDFIADAAEDPNTRVILCYLEDVSDGERFLDVASCAVARKPVIVLKSGTSQAGARAASSHTGALAGSDLAYDLAFRQCGVIRARGMKELFDLAVAFDRQPVPKGDRVAIVTNSGGPGIIATDCAEAAGLKLARFQKDTIDALRSSLPAEASIYNPVDVLGDARADRYRFALERVFSDSNVDGVLVLLCHAALTEPEETAEAIMELHNAYPEKPVFAAFMGGQRLEKGARMLTEAGIPCFTFPENGIMGLSGLARYRSFRNLPPAESFAVPENPDQKTVKAVFYDVKKDNRLVLLGSEAAEVAAAYGISVAPTALARSPEEAVRLAEEFGYPVVLKVASPKILHKTDVGGVIVGLEAAVAVREGYVEIIENVHRYLPNVVPHGVEVQKMMPRGIELIVGMTRDVQFGPILAFGLGGIYVNLLKDVSF
ncbi:MAG: acetate--CoA ligase, partial [Firmicutes bacterium]|nr:acetate--CoA ligase [Bacillota bacterium]